MSFEPDTIQQLICRYGACRTPRLDGSNYCNRHRNGVDNNTVSSYPRFYMIYVEGGNSPNHKHPSFEEAKTEADRLAKINIGRKVHILQALMGCTLPYAGVVWETVAP